MQESKINHPGIAAVLSFVFNGLGQLYNGQMLKGLFIIFLSVVNMLVLIAGSIIIGLWLLAKITSLKLLILGLGLFLCALVCICVLGIYSILDAHRVAAKKSFVVVVSRLSRKNDTPNPKTKTIRSRKCNLIKR